MSTGEFRRVFPAPRRRPGLFTVLVRWRLEVLLAITAAAVWWQYGGDVLAVGALAAAILVAVVAPLRRACLAVLRAVVLPHRVRSALVQAGVTDRAGRPPWVLGARQYGDTVVVWIWLRSGTTVDDLHVAGDVIGSACGAVDVEVTQPHARLDRATVILHRPRWGWFGE